MSICPNSKVACECQPQDGVMCPHGPTPNDWKPWESGVRAVDEAQLPHAHGPAVCDDCGHRWIAVWPLGAEALECPKCHSINTDREAQ